MKNLGRFSTILRISYYLLDGFAGNKVIKKCKCCKNDKRINRVYLTPKALEIKDEFLSSINAWENTLTSNLSYAEKEQALTLLKKITYNITHK